MTIDGLSEALLLDLFGVEYMEAMALMGSYARRQARPHSDIDVIRLTSTGATLAKAGSHIVNGHLVVVSDASPAQVESWFSVPQQAVSVLAGVRQARIIHDPSEIFARIQQRARNFRWTPALQAKADDYASSELVGLAEEVHKGLSAIDQPDDIGRLLNAAFGLSWGLSRIMQVQRGILAEGDNDFFAAVEAALGSNSEWVVLRRTAFGIGPDGTGAISLVERVRAGLKLYAATAALLADVITPEDREVIDHTVDLIGQLP